MKTPSTTQRSWISSLLLGLLLVLAVTGLLAYVSPYSATVADIHTTIGLVFLVIITWHLKNNLAALLNYFKMRIKWLVSLGLSLGLTLGVLLNLPGISYLADTGYQLRGAARVDTDKIVTLKNQLTENNQSVELETLVITGAHFESEPQPLFLGLTFTSTPQMAFWLEDEQGQHLKTLYVTEKLATSSFDSADIFSDQEIRRVEALPYWSHKRNKKYNDGLLIPTANDSDLDAITAATPNSHFKLNVSQDTLPERFRFMMEINRSFDFNDAWHKDRFPDDPVYTGSGNSGQPSLIYSAVIDLGLPNTRYLLEPVGHGHYSGQDGQLYTDLSGFDSALQLVDWVMVKVQANNRSIPEFAKK